MSPFGLFGPPDVEKLRRKRDVQGLMKALGHEKDENVRKHSAEALAGIGDAHVVDLLTTALADGDENVRDGAAFALGQIGDRRAVEPLITALEDPYGYVRQAAVEALGKIGDPRAVGPLIRRLGSTDDRYGHRRQAAAEALGKIGDPRAVGPLIETLDALEREGKKSRAESDEQYSRGLQQLRDEGISALGDFLTASLVDHLESQPGQNVTEAVVKALEQIGTEEATRRVGNYRGHMAGPIGKLPG